MIIDWWSTWTYFHISLAVSAVSFFFPGNLNELLMLETYSTWIHPRHCHASQDTHIHSSGWLSDLQHHHNPALALREGHISHLTAVLLRTNSLRSEDEIQERATSEAMTILGCNWVICNGKVEQLVQLWGLIRICEPSPHLHFFIRTFLNVTLPSCSLIHWLPCRLVRRRSSVNWPSNYLHVCWPRTRHMFA